MGDCPSLQGSKIHFLVGQVDDGLQTAKCVMTCEKGDVGFQPKRRSC